jgi:spermidine synthase
MRRRRGGSPSVRAQRVAPIRFRSHVARIPPADRGSLGARPRALLYFLFFCSGVSGLIYEVAWVRQFGNVFGNTVYSAAVVVAVFMLGLGAGGYFVGVWADRRYAKQPESLLRAYAWAELAIGLAGAALAVLLPRLVPLAATASSYSLDSQGWHVLSVSSYLVKSGLAIVLLTPVTFVMGGTLTLLIRHLARTDREAGVHRTALIYSVNTAGAAVGCFLTDFLLVPTAGLRSAQWTAVALNITAAAGAFLLTRLAPHSTITGARSETPAATVPADSWSAAHRSPTLAMSAASVGLAMVGFAAMGMQIVWLRHFSILLGEFRAVFSLLLTVILVGIGAGALAGGFLHRRTARAAEWLMLAQGLWVVSVLAGMAAADVAAIHAAASDVATTLSGRLSWTSPLREIWFNARPILAEVGVPALLMGLAFPLGNAVVQHAEATVARRAGLLYLSNTVGAVCGSLAAGFWLLPAAGLQTSTAILAAVGGLAVLPFSVLSAERISVSSPDRARARGAGMAAGALAAGAVAVGLWLQLPADHVIRRAQALPADAQLLALSEGVNETIAVTEAPNRGRALLTNGHPMAGTDALGQRYMRALAHIPLLSLDAPERVLVVGFGVGNTAHAAALHASVRRIEVVDLSRDVLLHADHFRDANHGVLSGQRVSVFVNDGRQHLLVQPPASYDLITLEPPPIAQAGVGALYSRDFYTLARTRLKPGGYISQWLPVYQVPWPAASALIRAFIDVFPSAVLLSGAKADLLLIGVRGDGYEVDPDRLAARLAADPPVAADLQRVALGTVREIVGSFVASARHLNEMTRDSPPVTDDRPIQEYSVWSLLNTGLSPGPASPSLADLAQIPEWCPRCFEGGKPVPLLEGIDLYLTLLDQFYTAPSVQPSPGPYGARSIEGSAYLGAILPETANLHETLGIAMMNRGELERATAAFREAVRLDAGSASAHWRLGNALAARGGPEALDHLQRAVQLDPDNASARYDLATSLFGADRYEEAIPQFRLALTAMPDAATAFNALGVGLVSKRMVAAAVDQFREAIRLRPGYVEAHNNLGTALAFQGKRAEAVEQFQQALALRPDDPDARRNLAILQRGAADGFVIAGAPLSAVDPRR